MSTSVTPSSPKRRCVTELRPSSSTSEAVLLDDFPAGPLVEPRRTRSARVYRGGRRRLAILIPFDFALPFTGGALEPFLNSAILGFWEENLMSKRWTTEEILKLKTMAQKYPAAKIAEELGRGTSAVFRESPRAAGVAWGQGFPSFLALLAWSLPAGILSAFAAHSDSQLVLSPCPVATKLYL